MPNLLLNSLAKDDFDRVLAECDEVRIEPRVTLIDTDQRIDWVYFPTSGLVSQLVVLADGRTIECATIGTDGFVGLSAYLGLEVSPVRFAGLAGGEALRISTTHLRTLVQDVPRLRTLLSRYNDFLLAETAQQAACNGLHNVEQRCSSWLLRACERLASDTVQITHEGLAELLGVRRSSVTVVMRMLQRDGVVRTGYGRLTILNRVGLREYSCECAEATHDRYETLFATLMG